MNTFTYGGYAETSVVESYMAVHGPAGNLAQTLWKYTPLFIYFSIFDQWLEIAAPGAWQ